MFKGITEMNIWVILAAICGIGTIVFGYIGAQQQSGADSKHLEAQLDKLGERITDLNDSEVSSESDLVEINEDYAKLAGEFKKSRHQKAAKIIAGKSGHIASQLVKTEEAKQRFTNLYETTLSLVAAYNEQSEETKVEVIRSDFPENLFSKDATDNVYIGLFIQTER